jgi:hypothetical protein
MKALQQIIHRVAQNSSRPVGTGHAGSELAKRCLVHALKLATQLPNE